MDCFGFALMIWFDCCGAYCASWCWMRVLGLPCVCKLCFAVLLICGLIWCLLFVWFVVGLVVLVTCVFLLFLCVCLCWVGALFGDFRCFVLCLRVAALGFDLCVL